MTVAAVLALGAVACGGADDNDAGVPVPQISAEAQAILEQARADVEVWYGTLADRHAAEIVVAGRHGAAYETCMQEAGHSDADWRDALSGSMWREPVVRSFWLISPEAEVLSADLYALQSATMYGTSASGAEGDHERCRTAGQGSGSAAVRTPPHFAGVDDDFTFRLQEAMAPFGAATDFVECVEALEADVVAGEHLDHVFGEHAQERVTEALASGGETDFRAWELQVNAALWECSRDTFEEAVRLLPGVVAAHGDAHAREIMDLAAHWRNVRDEAADLWNA